MKGAAVALNKFDGDGSFLEKFQAHSVGGQLSSGKQDMQASVLPCF